MDRASGSGNSFASSSEWDMDSASDYFGSMREEYDSLIRRAVPRYAELTDTLLDYLPPSAGSILFADQMNGGTAANHSLNWSRWLEYCRRPGNCSEDEISGLLDHAEAHDCYVSVPDHFRILEEAGFEGLDCVWRHGMWGVITAGRR